MHEGVEIVVCILKYFVGYNIMMSRCKYNVDIKDAVNIFEW